MTDFSTPRGAPLVPQFPIQFRDTAILTIVYRTSRQAVEAVLPEPLVAASDYVMMHYYHMRDPDWFGPHFEYAVQVDAALPGAGVRGAYSPFIMLTTDGGLATGREIYGQPKKSGKPSIEVNGDLIIGRAERNGIDVATVTLPYKQTRASIDELKSYIPFTNNINYKFVPHIDGRPAIRQLTSREFDNVVVHECWKGPGTVELRPHAQFPVYRLPVESFVEGFYWRVDLTLVFGRIIHDYLREGKE
ncbi:acetoacetate decarboxylase [Paenibacillus sp. GCM10027626]|uniref:acetoacetate decarboxylase n=1 Tax=Paenibacillus sp. GCM10027626 TaxID=3273411 RepID=UPI003639FBF5